MLVIVKNVTASSEEAKIVVAGQEIEADLKDLLEYVLPMPYAYGEAAADALSQ